MRRGPAIVAFFAFLVFVYGTIVCVQNKLSAMSASAKVPASMAYLPESEKIRPWLFGFHSVFADYLWIRTTIYFGGHYMSDREYPWLIHMVDIITRLNPRFYPAYEFGGLMFSKICNNPGASKIVLQRGISANIEKKWKLYFFLGMLYYEQYEDFKSASLYTAIAAQMPGAPAQKLMNLAVSMYNKIPGLAEDGRSLALLYTASENPEVRRFLLEKLKNASW